jgi:ubiquitin carboxyl-terminal hydrolase 9/13
LYYQAADIDTVSLGLRSPDPAPLESLSTSASTPLLPPTLHSTPVLPPGLDHDNTSSDASDPPFPITPSLGTHLPEFLADKPALVVAPVTGAVSDQSPFPNSATPTSPTGITKIFNTLRRAPSISIPRGSVGSASAGHGPDIRRSGVERSPRPSSSTPSLTADDARRSLEPPPPLPPLPPIIHAAPPTSIPQIISGEEKEPSKKSPGGWFRKRKSLRLNDKSRPEDYPASPALPSSPAHVQRGNDPEEAQLSMWFKTGDQPKRKSKRRPSESGLSGPAIDGLHPNRPRPKSTHSGVAAGKHERERHHRPNGYDESPPPSSASSSYNSFSQQPLARATRPSTGASSSSSTSGQHVDQPPPKMSPLTPLSPDQQRPPYDHARQQKERSPSKVNVNHKGSQSPLSYTKSQGLDRNLPPLPPTPQFLSRSSSSHQRNDSNGHAFVAEPNGAAPEGDDLGNGSVFAASISTPMSRPSVSRVDTTLPPSSMATSIGVNMSTGSSSSASAVSGIRRATRKLSFSAPMLGFGRKDKDKDKKS